MPDADVCVIGGGIQGCGVAQAAAAAGYRTLLLEQTALAHATSSRSSKLIHGGLRYLESGQFGLVAKSLAERERLLQNAPDLVERVPFYIPIYKYTRRRPWQVALGLGVYALLGKLRPGCGFRRVPARDWDRLDGLNQDGLQVVYQYWDAHTDDVQLTRAVMHSAIELGAQLHCPARFLSASHEQDHFRIEYLQDNKKQHITSRVLVNAAGPWIREVHHRLDTDIALPPVDLVQGAHLILNQPAPSGVYYVESSEDQRAVFIMPWHGNAMIGTTETIVSTDPAALKPTAQETAYLLRIANDYFPGNDNKVINQFAGVRVLLKTSTGVFRRPRDTLLFSHAELPGYLALIGGKLTAYRITAEHAVRLLQEYLPMRRAIADTRELKLARVTETL